MGPYGLEADKKKAKLKKATLVFIDEAGIMMSPTVRKTWAPCGKTPILKHKTRSHRKISAIGEISVRHSGRSARVMFRLLEGKNMRTAECIQFLIQLKQNIRGPIIIIWDRLQAHRSKALNVWLAGEQRIELEYFPPYAPELNPVEYLWAHLKSHELANFCAFDLEGLYRETKSKLCSMRPCFGILVESVTHCNFARFFQSLAV